MYFLGDKSLMQSLVFDAIVTEVLERPSPSTLKEDKQYVSLLQLFKNYIIYYFLCRIDILWLSLAQIFIYAQL